MSRPKRKSAGQPQYAANLEDDTSSSTTPKAPSPPKKPSPRRSSRRIANQKASHIPDKGAGVLPDEDNVEQLQKDTSTPEEFDVNLEEEKDMAKAGVQEAIKGLARMERRFQRATKRQKLKVEESVVIEKFDSPRSRAFMPKEMELDKSETLIVGKPTRKQALPATERDTVEGDEDQSCVDEGVDVDEHDKNVKVAERGAARPPPVNSDYLPLPWKGRLGYACLNTYLRAAKPPVFSSRTCRLASIIEHRHPLADPSLPEHATKNRPDKTKPADHSLGEKFVQELGLANARDIVKMLKWNDKYGIKFMRLSSEMFPFASHQELGYKLAPFASEVLAEAGKVAAELGHRLTTHPGQFTQLGSPRKEVVTNAVRDLEYHDEMLSLLKLPPQQDRDAVMILHMGGTFGDKKATLDRFRDNYTTLLSDGIKKRLVLENDDVSWSVHDLLPICEELNIPLVLDYHHHNIVFDASQCREGTYDIAQPGLTERIKKTWTRKKVTQKWHYSEPRPGAVTPRDRRKHSPRVATLPPVPRDADLMIEAKDKEQAVFELMRTFRLPGFETIRDMIPFEREDEDRAPAARTPKKRAPKKRKSKKAQAEAEAEAEEDLPTDEAGDENGVEAAGIAPTTTTTISSEDFGMGGPLGRVYWPVGMEEWLKPKKKERKAKSDENTEV